MTDTDLKLADAAAARLSETALRTLQNTMRVDEAAISAFVQNVVTQAAVQALINLLKSKNLIGVAELDRVLAKAYDDAESEAARRGLVAVARRN
jgi:hypothetical protein